MRESTYEAAVAGLSYSVSNTNRGLQLTVAGYDDKLGAFAAGVASQLNQGLKLNRFEEWKDTAVRAAAAFDDEQPYMLASYYTGLALEPRSFRFENTEVRSELAKVTQEDVREFEKAALKEGRLSVLVQGNLKEKDAETIAATVKSALSFAQASPSSKFPPYFFGLVLPRRCRPITLKITNPNAGNDKVCVDLLIQAADKSRKGNAVAQIVGTIVSQPFYDSLRTKQQLGYIVSSGVKSMGEMRSLAFLVQSGPEHSESEVEAAIGKFVKEFGKQIDEMSEEDVGKFVRAGAERSLERDKRLGTEVVRNWSEIASGKFEYDRRQREAVEMMGVTKKDVVAWWKEWVDNSSGRRSIVTKILPQNAKTTKKSSRLGLQPSRLDVARLFDENDEDDLVVDFGQVDDLRKALERQKEHEMVKGRD